jgi:hypothetical protein
VYRLSYSIAPSWCGLCTTKMMRLRIMLINKCLKMSLSMCTTNLSPMKDEKKLLNNGYIFWKFSQLCMIKMVWFETLKNTGKYLVFTRWKEWLILYERERVVLCKNSFSSNVFDVSFWLLNIYYWYFTVQSYFLLKLLYKKRPNK